MACGAVIPPVGERGCTLRLVKAEQERDTRRDDSVTGAS